jgi:hypothetical protein
LWLRFSNCGISFQEAESGHEGSAADPTGRRNHWRQALFSVEEACKEPKARWKLSPSRGGCGLHIGLCGVGQEV